MAEQNAGNELKNLIEDRLSDQTLLLRLQKQLNLARLPVRIECFDNSNISGTQPVSGMVVFEHTRPKKSDYRKYRIKTVSEPDDYATMAEVLKRRYGRGEDSAPLPDLLMVDGGKGQLGIAVSVLDELNLTGRFDVIGIAKKDDMKGETQDKIYKPGRLNPMNLDRDGNLLLFSAADSGRGPSVCHYLSPVQTGSGSDPFGAGQHSRSRTKTKAGASQTLWQHQGHPGRLHRRIEPGPRHESKNSRNDSEQAVNPIDRR